MTAMLALTIPLSVKSIAWGMVVMSALELVLNLSAAKSYTSLSVWRLVRTLLPICALTGVMYGVVMVAGVYLSALHVGAILAIKILLGIAIYTLGAMLCNMESWREIISIAKQLIGKRKEL